MPKKKDLQNPLDFSKAFMVILSFMNSLSSTLKFVGHSFEVGGLDPMPLVLRLDTHPSSPLVFGTVKSSFFSSQSQCTMFNYAPSFAREGIPFDMINSNIQV